MCVVSQITDYGQKIWPNPWALPYRPVEYPLIPISPVIPTVPSPAENDDSELLMKFKEFMDLINKAKETDAILEQPDCPDPEKADWIKKLEDRIEDLEKKLDKKQDKIKMYYWDGINETSQPDVIPYMGG